MPIIQFVLPSKNKHIKKLLQCVTPLSSLLARKLDQKRDSELTDCVRPPLVISSRFRSFYFEICPKLDENGKLKQEMILVW